MHRSESPLEYAEAKRIDKNSTLEMSTEKFCGLLVFPTFVISYSSTSSPYTSIVAFSVGSLRESYGTKIVPLNVEYLPAMLYLSIDFPGEHSPINLPPHSLQKGF